MTTVGWVGLGDQGAALLSRLLESDHDVVVWARRPESVVPFRETRVRSAASPALLGSEADYVGICVNADADVWEVVIDGGLLEAMRPGSTLALHSTVSPDLCRRLERTARRRDVAVIDAPVTRDGASQRTARFTFFVGGSLDDVRRRCDVLEAMAAEWFHMGPVGSGQCMKLINNAVAAANLGIVFEAIDAAGGLGLDPDQVLTALERSSAASAQLRFLPFYRPVPRSAYVETLGKDVGLFRRACAVAGGGVARFLGVSATATIDRLTALQAPSDGSHTNVVLHTDQLG